MLAVFVYLRIIFIERRRSVCQVLFLCQ